MIEYRFQVVVRQQADSEQEILNLADKLAEAGCDDAHLAGHREGIEVVFDRQAKSRDEAMRTAVNQIEACGLAVARIELDREAIAG
ncbi:hypothetical protein OAG71_04890 [bacterium]|nr:hypothetical protein [bacterium]